MLCCSRLMLQPDYQQQLLYPRVLPVRLAPLLATGSPTLQVQDKVARIQFCISSSLATAHLGTCVGAEEGADLHGRHHRRQAHQARGRPGRRGGRGGPVEAVQVRQLLRKREKRTGTETMNMRSSESVSGRSEQILTSERDLTFWLAVTVVSVQLVTVT